ncbi:MAG: hypothetical protein IT238_09725 [Bacteroidia bacterium]|nr:hypothetical protein [Bacteroidia bacterium]MCZ2249583.1 cytochrome c [Bacteroidia bacterium]
MEKYLSEKLKLLGLLFAFFHVSLVFNSAYAQMSPEVLEGKNLFEGRVRFENRGPSCISCHSVNSKDVAMGGLLAKNLTDVYTRMGEGLSAWLAAPPFPAMASSYQNNPLTDSERVKLQTFLKYVNDADQKTKVAEDKGYGVMLTAGLTGVAIIIIFIGIIWRVRKTKMVKQEIFDRQIKAVDAKF